MDNKNLPAAFTTMRWTNEHGFLLSDYHCQRLASNAYQLGYSSQHLAAQMRDTDAELRKTLHKAIVRIDIGPKGATSATVRAMPQIPISPLVALDTSPTDSSNMWLQIKSTNRQRYEQARQTAAINIFDVVLWNENNQLTEATFHNIVLRLAGQYLTPRLSAGLLAGTMRQRLLDNGLIAESDLTTADLDSAEEIFMINSVRGWIKVCLSS